MSVYYVEEGYVSYDYTQSDITIDWRTKDIFIPKFYLTLISGHLYKLDTLKFKRTIADIMDNAQGMVNDDPVRHNTVVTLSGVDYARFIEIINDYTVTFENGTYAVSLVGSNNNIVDVKTINSVSVIPNNSAGLVDNSYGTLDYDAPTWDTTTGIVNAYQNGANINISWGSASDRNEVRYNIYISQFDIDVFNSANLLTSDQGHFYPISVDTGGALEDGKTYYMGVRAIDIAGNETSNTNYASVLYTAVVESGALTPEQHNKLMTTSTKSDVINASML